MRIEAKYPRKKTTYFMENIIFSANVVLPLLLIMIIGYGAHQLNWLTSREATVFNNLAFMVFLPALLFNNVRFSTLSSLANTSLFAFVIIGSLASFAIGAIIVPFIEPENTRRGVMIQGMARTNYSLFGIPLLTLLMPEADIGIASILVAVIIPIYNIVCVVILTYYGSKSANLKKVLLGILKNPLILSTLSGVLFLVNGWALPTALDSAMVSLGNAATPLSLFLLGASFDFQKLHAVLKQTIITVTGRLIIVPVIAISIAVALGFRDMELATIMIVFSSPTAVSSYTMAEKMGCDAPLASAVVIFSSLFCIFSLFLIILFLKAFALI